MLRAVLLPRRSAPTLSQPSRTLLLPSWGFRVGELQRLLANQPNKTQRNEPPTIVREFTAQERTYWNKTLNQLVKQKKYQTARKLYLMKKREGFTPDDFTNHILLTLYGKEGRIMEMMRLFTTLKREGKATLSTFTLVMNLLGKQGETNVLVELFHILKQEGMTPTSINLNIIIDNFGKQENWQQMNEYFEIAKKEGLADTQTYTTVMNFYGKRGMFTEMLQLFQEMQICKITPNVVTYNTLIDCFGKAGRADEMYQLYQEMLSKELQPDAATHGSLLCGYAVTNQVGKMLAELKEMISRKYHIGIGIFNTVIEAFARIGDEERMVQYYNLLLERKLRPNAQSFNAMLQFYISRGDKSRVLGLLKDMEEKGAVPDTTTGEIVLKFFRKQGDLLNMQQFFQSLKILGVYLDEEVLRLMINTYHSHGKMDEIREITQYLLAREELTVNMYNMLLYAFGLLSDSEKILKTYQRLKQQPHLLPDIQTYYALVEACINSNQFDWIPTVRREMEHDYKLKPSYDLLLKLVESYTNRGHIMNALSVLGEMKFGFWNYKCAKRFWVEWEKFDVNSEEIKQRLPVGFQRQLFAVDVEEGSPLPAELKTNFSAMLEKLEAKYSQQGQQEP